MNAEPHGISVVSDDGIFKIEATEAAEAMGLYELFDWDMFEKSSMEEGLPPVIINRYNHDIQEAVMCECITTAQGNPGQASKIWDDAGFRMVAHAMLVSFHKMGGGES